VPGSPQAQFNATMSARRVVVEWAYGMVCQVFQSVDFKRYNHILWTRPGAVYRTAILLLNMRSAFLGDNRISLYFGLQPPTLENYIAGLWSGDSTPPGLAPTWRQPARKLQLALTNLPPAIALPLQSAPTAACQ